MTLNYLEQSFSVTKIQGEPKKTGRVGNFKIVQFFWPMHPRYIEFLYVNNITDTATL